MESIEAETSRAKDFKKEVRDVYVHVAELSLLGECILEWNDADAKEYHRKRPELDSQLVRFRNTGMIRDEQQRVFNAFELVPVQRER